MVSKRTSAALAACLLAAGGLAGAGCGGDDATAGTGGEGLSGTIVIDGSSTVAPLSSAAAESFNARHAGVDLEVRTSGTGGGFEVFCKGETDIADASRPIAEDERRACAGAGVEYEEFRVASDGITLVTTAGAQARIGRSCLSYDELRRIWAAGSAVRNWKDAGEGFNDVPLTLAGPGSESGTYDFFNEEVLGEDESGEVRSPRQDYSASEDDNVIVRAVAGAPAALGYFGWSYYEENSGRLEAFEVDAGGGCVAPSVETITSGEYPLSRPLLIYVNKERLQQPHVREFVRHYLTNGVQLAQDAGFVPAPQEALDEALSRVPPAS